MPKESVRATATVLVLLSVMLALLRAATVDVPLDRDITYYSSVGHELLQGRPLYTWLLDHKPLGVHLAFAGFEAIFGRGLWTFVIMSWVMSCITMVAIHRAATSLANANAGHFAALFWASVSGLREMAGHTPNTEAFMNPCLVGALALLLSVPARTPDLSFRRCLTVGFLMFLATFLKQVVATVALAMLAAHVVAGLADNPRSTWRRIGESTLAGCVVLLGWACYLGYFILTGRGEPLHDGLVLFNRDYAGSLKVNIFDGLLPEKMFPALFAGGFGPVLFIAITVGLCGMRAPLRTRLMLVAFGVGTSLAVSLPGRFYGHYYQLWLPLICILAGWGATCWKRAALPYSRRWWPAAGILAVLFTLWMQKRAFQDPVDSYEVPASSNVYVHTRRVGQRIAQHFPQGGRMFHWGPESGLYFFSGMRPSTGWLAAYGVVEGPLALKLQAKQIRELTAEPPDLVVLYKADAPNGLGGNPVLDSLRDKYIPWTTLPETRNFLLFIRKPDAAPDNK